MPSRAVPSWLVLVLILSVSACTGDGDGPDPTTASSGSPSPSLDVGSRGFVYRAPGIEATFELTDGRGRLVVLNETGFALGRPDLYVLDARDGARVPGEVLSSSRIPDGATRRFDVTIQGAPEHEDIGMVALLFGGDNYGAFETARKAR